MQTHSTNQASAAAFAQLAPLREACASGAPAGYGDGRDWARKVVQRHASGERVNLKGHTSCK